MLSRYLVAYYDYHQPFLFFPAENWFYMKKKQLSLIKMALAWLVMSKTVASVGAEVFSGQVFHTVASLSRCLKMLIVMRSDGVTSLLDFLAVKLYFLSQ